VAGGPEYRVLPPCSPELLLQERVRGDPWRVLLVCALLNRTQGVQAEPALWVILSRWPTADALADADVEQLEAVIRPLGLWRRRARTLKCMSADYYDKGGYETVHDPRTIPGCGQYAADAWSLFVEGRALPPGEVGDVELRRYAEWRARPGSWPAAGATRTEVLEALWGRRS
jgi:endonuclease III